MSKEGTLIKHRYPIEYLNNVDISSAGQIEYKKSELKSYIDGCKADLIALAVATPKDITNSKNPFIAIKEHVNDILDDMSEHYYDYWTVEHIENIIDEWKWGWVNPENEIFDNTKTDDELNSNAFPEEKFVELKRDKNTFSFTPTDDNISQAIDRAIENIELTDNESNFYKDKCVIFYKKKNTFLANFYGQFIFKDELTAKTFIKKRLNINPFEYLSYSFISEHKDFFSTVIEYARNSGVDEDTINKFNSALNEFIDNQYKFCQEPMQVMYDFIESTITDAVCNKLGLQIVKISDIVNITIL